MTLFGLFAALLVAEPQTAPQSSSSPSVQAVGGAQVPIPSNPHRETEVRRRPTLAGRTLGEPLKPFARDDEQRERIRKMFPPSLHVISPPARVAAMASERTADGGPPPPPQPPNFPVPKPPSSLSARPADLAAASR